MRSCLLLNKIAVLTVDDDRFKENAVAYNNTFARYVLKIKEYKIFITNFQPTLERMI